MASPGTGYVQRATHKFGSTFDSDQGSGMWRRSSRSVLLLVWYVISQSTTPNYQAIAAAAPQGSDSTFSFSFTSFDDASCSSGSMCLVGDALLRNGSIELTSIDDGEGQSAGRAMLATPVRFVNTDANTTASFRSSFTFSIMNQDEIHYGDGLAFIIVKQQSVSNIIGGPGGWLGFLSAGAGEQQGRNSKSLAVEFDTYLNVEFGDPNDNHVGVDVNSMRSTGFADAGSESVQLKSGKPITAWVDYDSSRQELEVSLSYSKEQKPQKRLLSLSINLRAVLDEYMYVGFSAATGGNVELHTLHSWSFASFGLEPPSRATVDDDHTSTPPAPAPGVPSLHSSSSRCSRKLACLATARFLAISTASAVAGAIAVSVMLWLICSSSSRSYRPMGMRLPSLRRSTSFSSMLGGPRKFTYKELSSATKGFSPSKVLGHGAFGTVYKGQVHLEDGSEVQVAVKRADKGSKHGKEEFMSELSIIGCLRHRNLVQLQGWCRERGELLLVYDYMPNGSLDKLLFGGCTNLLSWSCRLKIVVGVGAALAYLHSEWEQRVVHRDVKASNIMLDANLNARLGDFGLARLIEHDTSPETTITAGTLGYLAPEYLHTGKATEKTDVFSFGIVALEVATGRRPILDKDKDKAELPSIEESSTTSLLLVDWVWKLHKQGKLMEAADPKLGGEFEQQEMLLLFQVGLLCSHPDPGARPTMKQVVQILCGATSIPALPKLKPTPSFASVPPLSIQDIISDSDTNI